MVYGHTAKQSSQTLYIMGVITCGCISEQWPLTKSTNMSLRAPLPPCFINIWRSLAIISEPLSPSVWLLCSRKLHRDSVCLISS